MQDVILVNSLQCVSYYSQSYNAFGYNPCLIAYFIWFKIHSFICTIEVVGYTFHCDNIVILIFFFFYMI